MVTRSIRARTTALNDAQLAMLQTMLEEQRRFRIEQLAAAAEPHQAQPVRTEADLEVQETILRGARLALTDVESALDTHLPRQLRAMRALRYDDAAGTARGAAAGGPVHAVPAQRRRRSVTPVRRWAR